MCGCATPRRASRSVPEEQIFEGKVRGTKDKRCPLLELLQAPCTRFLHLGFYWGTLSLFFFWRGKPVGLLLQSQGLPAHGGLSFRAENVPAHLSSHCGSWHNREDKIKAEYRPSLSRIQPLEDWWRFHIRRGEK